MDSTCNLASGDGKDGPNIKVDYTRVPVYTCVYLWWGWKHGYVNSESWLIMEQISKVSTPWASSLRVLSSWYFFHLRFLLHVIAVVDAMVQVLQEFLLIQFRDNPNTECSVTPLHPSSWAHSIVTGEAFVPALPLCAFAILAATCWHLWLLLYIISFNTQMLCCWLLHKWTKTVS